MIRAERAARLAAEARAGDLEIARAALEVARLEVTQAHAARYALELEIERLKLQIAKLRRQHFGTSSERGARLEQLLLALEDLEESAAHMDAEAEAKDAAAAPGAPQWTVEELKRAKPARRPLPGHLPRRRVVLPGPTACACCGGGLRKLGEVVTETLERIPARWIVVETVREKFSCAACETITETPAPFHAIPRGRAGPHLLAEITVGKFDLHLPLTRQSTVFAQEGIDLDVSTLCDWIGAVAVATQPLSALLAEHVMQAERLHADDTPVPVLAKGKTKTGRLWTVVRDDRPFAGADPPAAVYYYSADRKGEHPQSFLKSYSGILQADAYSGFGQLYEPGRATGPATEAACWAHARRQFFELAELKKGPIAIEAVKRIDALFAIERAIIGRPPDERRSVRAAQSKPLVDDLERWLRAQRGRLSPKSETAKAINYMLRRWASFALFLDDGRVCLSNNAAERAIRGIAVGRRNWTFAGSDVGGHRAAALYTLVETCKLNEVDPRAWLADVLTRLPEHPAKRLAELLPWNWEPLRDQQAAA
ncbi:IS66 family transposase [Paenibacillus sp.]|uniref:IS66 family transposase n=1 Tax=Paenibacillus sp. TaxID=58172 RepID=UPI003567A934